MNNTLKDIIRHLGEHITRKRPVTHVVLKLILSQLDVSVSFDAAVWAACLVSFYGLLRTSNVMVSSEAAFEADNVCRGKTFYSITGELLIRWTNTNPFQS